MPVAGDVDHVVDAADDPEVAVLVLAGGVADEVRARCRTSRSTSRRSGRRRRRACAASRATGWSRTSRPCLSRSGSSPSDSSSTAASMPGSGVPAEPGFMSWAPGQRGDHDLPGLGLPPGVDDRAALAADHLPVPQPGLRVDRLADRAQQAHARQVVLLGVLDAPLHARADRGRRGVEDRHARSARRAPTRCPCPGSPGAPSYITDVAPLESGP